MRRRFIVSSEYSERLARPDGTCFYCQAAVGTEHNEGCVIRSKTMVIDYTIRLCLDVPEDWDDETIVFCRGGGSSWCASNILGDIEHAIDHRGCICGTSWAEVVREADEEDEDALGVRWEGGHLEEAE